MARPPFILSRGRLDLRSTTLHWQHLVQFFHVTVIFSLLKNNFSFFFWGFTRIDCLEGLMVSKMLRVERRQRRQHFVNVLSADRQPTEESVEFYVTWFQCLWYEGVLSLKSKNKQKYKINNLKKFCGFQSSAQKRFCVLLIKYPFCNYLYIKQEESFCQGTIGWWWPAEIWCS